MTWQNQLSQNITTVEELKDYINLAPEEQALMEDIVASYPLSISKYYLSLVDKDDPEDPIRRMCIPSVYETDLSGSFDTSGEASNTKLPGLQHKYSATALVLSTNLCATYCRHCFRKRMVGSSDDETVKIMSGVVNYVSEHAEIDNVLISGGDSLLNSNAVIQKYLEGLSKIPHLDFIRFGTRMPVMFPERINADNELLEIFKKYSAQKKLYVVTQFNHPRELTEQAAKAVTRLISCGITVSNQTVLLKGVNDCPQTLAELMKGLTRLGVVPYYVFQCRPVSGVKNQFQITLKQGTMVVEKAKALLNGHAKRFRYALSHPKGKIEILGPLEDGRMVFKFAQAKDPADNGRVFALDIADDCCWL